MADDYLVGEMYLAPDLAEAVTASPDAARMRDTHDFMRKGFDAIGTALRTPDPTQTAEAQMIAVSKKAGQWLNDCARKAEASRLGAERAMEAIDRQIADELAIVDGKAGLEIRTHFKSLGNNDRINAIREAIENRDTETLGALFSGKYYLSGFKTADEQALFRNQYAEKYAAKPIALKAALKRSVAVNDRTFNSALVEVGNLLPKAKIAEIASRIEKANAARDNILNG